MGLPPETEAGFQKTVISYARLRGFRVAHFRTARVQSAKGKTFYATPVAADGAGFPDLCMVRGQRVIFAELKTDRGVLSAEQKAWGELLVAVGGTVEYHVWRPRDWDRVREQLD